MVWLGNKFSLQFFLLFVYIDNIYFFPHFVLREICGLNFQATMTMLKKASWTVWLSQLYSISMFYLCDSGYLHIQCFLLKISLTMYNSELLQSEFLNEPREDIEEREVAIQLRERIDEQELLLEFLLMIQQRKQEVAINLQDSISFLSSDIEEVTKQQSLLWRRGGSCPELGKDSASSLPSMEVVDNGDSSCLASRKRYRPGLQNQNEEESGDCVHSCENSEEPAENQGSFLSKSSRLMKDFKKLESAYFLTRRRSIKSSGKPLTRQSPISSDGRRSIVVTERSSINNLPSVNPCSEGRQSGWVNSFLEGLCKYLSFSNLKVKADLKQGDLLNSSNLVCSLSFDRDGEFFATAGVNKKIKVFEYATVLNEDRDIHYPVVELSSRSKLSSICWNSYIKSQIASSNFEGVVQVGQTLFLFHP